MRWVESNKINAEGKVYKFIVFDNFEEALTWVRNKGWIKKKIIMFKSFAKKYCIDTQSYSTNFGKDVFNYASELQIIIEESLFICWDLWQKCENKGSFLAYAKKSWDTQISKLIKNDVPVECLTQKFENYYSNIVKRYIEDYSLSEDISTPLQIDYLKDSIEFADWDVYPTLSIESKVNVVKYNKQDVLIAKMILSKLELTKEELEYTLTALDGGYISSRTLLNLEEIITEKVKNYK